MTISELKNGYTAPSGLLSEKDFVIGFDISAEQELSPADYTAAENGIISLLADFSRRDIQRKYVDGDRVVPLSEMRRFTLKFRCIARDAVQRFIIAAATAGTPVKYTYEDLSDGTADSGTLLAKITSQEKSDIYGMIFTVVMEKT